MRLQIGYVPLCDAAPVVMAQELGFAREEGLELELSAEPSWATLRDRLALGHLDGAHMLAPLALASAMGLSGPPSDVVVGLPLSLNGNAITLSHALCEAMAEEAVPGEGTDGWRGAARAFARIAAARRRAGRPLTMGIVHPFSCHAYQVRLFAAAGGLDPAALRTVVVPPQHGVEALSRGLVDGFCAGAPWNDVAVAAGVGRIAALCAEIAPMRRKRCSPSPAAPAWPMPPSSGPSPGPGCGARIPITGTNSPTASAAGATSTGRSMPSPAPSGGRGSMGSTPASAPCASAPRPRPGFPNASTGSCRR